jgi:hypothetical protein
LQIGKTQISTIPKLDRKIWEVLWIFLGNVRVACGFPDFIWKFPDSLDYKEQFSFFLPGTLFDG